jgi:hypothetical protein
MITVHDLSFIAVSRSPPCDDFWFEYDMGGRTKTVRPSKKVKKDLTRETRENGRKQEEINHGWTRINTDGLA